ncbi:MAG: bifunctional aspartate kinase/homoserine dehydrogenase I [Treponema sp.]|jgi:aspartokinase/homoserine dehydrogenase 1|nr:bifunctional aspartate kinase/homoserine dehydrogenase I [Treponema sp.]
MLIAKFGGTSVGSAEGIERILHILRDDAHRGRTRAVVVSAFSKVTDSLIALAREAERGKMPDLAPLRERHLDMASRFLSQGALARTAAAIDGLLSELHTLSAGIAALRELSPRALDRVMGFGERLSALTLAAIFSEKSLPAEALDARGLVVTDGAFGKARFLEAETYRNIRAYFDRLAAGGNSPLQVVTGFIGATPEGIPTTLGRGGSDLSAAIFGAALGAEVVEIWTDVDGILTSDPRMVKGCLLIESISYEEAMELSHFGAKVLYPPTIQPSLEKNIPIWIRNTFRPEGPGTRIVRDAGPSPFPIRGISLYSGVSLLRLQGAGMVGVAGFSARFFGALARRAINVILITQSSSEYSICAAILPADAASAEEALQEEFAGEIARGIIDAPITEGDLSIVAVVGARMKRATGVSGKVFHALGRNGINVVAIAQGSSELNISAVISRQDEAKAMNAVHEAFFFSGVRSVNLFLVGLGLIGGTLAEQIGSHKDMLAAEDQIRINLVGAANSKKMLFDGDGLDPVTIKERLKSDGQPYRLDAFIERMKAMNLPNAAFCDCTASEDVAGVYAEALGAAIAVVTPNKRANAGPLARYLALTGSSRERGIPYLYETTVCAGLPVISTLRDLFHSGDRVRRIEAVLSGTLSFIFNNFDGSKPFSALVREAKERGYTEPDPRDDLNAMDAARKALILARECGFPLEFSSVAIEPILPAACFEAPDTEAFFRELEKADAAFEVRRAAAAAAGRVLRYMAVIEEGSARLALREEGAGSPFLSLTDSDNIVVIRTDRYATLPMVIKGPGAGAQVTAGGVFADIVRIARTLV